MFIANITILIVNLVLAATIIGLSIHRGLAEPTGLDWNDFAAILLTSVAVVLAGVTVFIAAAAIWGYNAIKTAAENKAREVAEKVAIAETREAMSDQFGALDEDEEAKFWQDADDDQPG
ncbi:hypothetical protein C882_3192 [Caenispirillum salinarum AK4]|uniref:Uncharacterized protein n=1 Tax=Caenispirillum salinarum AK4 TaxID=1238182 RepID=K9HPD5_9PROT|nr:hypothetical protein [Caenispirillum salinarum]EKV32128.1 hypothetical protein C882_3192 [Caenispirillum salinarum AK4]